MRSCKRHQAIPFCSPVIVYDTVSRTVSEEVNGEIEMRIISEVVDVSNSDANIPDRKEYTLSNLLAAGVPLEQINPKLLNPTDYATLEEMSVDGSLAMIPNESEEEEKPLETNVQLSEVKPNEN